MKRIRHLTVSCGLVLLLLTGCGDNSGHTGQNNSVDNVLKQQTEHTEQTAETIEPTEERTQDEQDSPDDGETDSRADYDLTEMGSDMVYATVYQLMVNPDDYIGKTIKMEGLYYAVYYEPTAQYYHYCIIEDATACCAQGLEFVWNDETRKYPEDYPADYTKIIVTGTFETYQEDNDPSLYCRLSNAVLEIEASWKRPSNMSAKTDKTM